MQARARVVRTVLSASLFLFAVRPLAAAQTEEEPDAARSAAAAADLAPLAPSAVRQIQAIVNEKLSRTPTERKISSMLLSMAKARKRRASSAPAEGLKPLVAERLDGRFRRVIRTAFYAAADAAQDFVGNRSDLYRHLADERKMFNIITRATPMPSTLRFHRRRIRSCGRHPARAWLWGSMMPGSPASLAQCKGGERRGAAALAVVPEPRGQERPQDTDPPSRAHHAIAWSTVHSVGGPAHTSIG
jgi:hypothetical protein